MCILQKAAFMNMFGLSEVYCWNNSVRIHFFSVCSSVKSLEYHSMGFFCVSKL